MTAVSRPATASRIVLGGALVDLLRRDDVVSAVGDRLGAGGAAGPPGVPLAIGSANLDHVHHFGRRGRSAADIDVAGQTPEWLILLDGAPMVRRAASLTGQSWPLLAGSDLLPVLLDTAQSAGARVGFLGGSAQMHDIVRPVLADRYPDLTVAGFWAPPRADLADGEASARLAGSIRGARVDLLVVGLGKPRQERWIQRHAGASGARVLLAFGAATDFLAGTVTRAPGWVRRAGVEWLYRLALEPRRLARRYCVQGPPALWRLWTDSRR